MARYPLHEGALAYARSQIGVHEDPWGSNRGGIQRTNPRGGVDFYEDHDFLAGHGYPWCVDFWLTCWAEGAKHVLPYRTAGAYAMLAWARGAGWAKPSKECVAGDAIVFNVGSGHLGMLESWSGDTCNTISGNHGNAVGRASYHYSLVAGGVHVPEQAYKPVHVPKPYWVIVTSERGHRVLVFSKFATQRTVLGLLPKLLAKYGRHGVTITRGKERGK